MHYGNFFNPEHPEISKISRDFTAQMLWGRIFSLQHPKRFKKTRLFKYSNIQQIDTHQLNSCNLQALVSQALLDTRCYIYKT